MRPLLRLWFGLTEPVSRVAYALSGFGLMGLKYAVEALLVHHFTGRRLTPLDYFSPLLTSRQAVVGDADWLLVFPTAYWSLWSHALIHAIHQRVLGHIKELSESA